MQPADLTLPEYDPPNCPSWAREQHPDWIRPYVGVNGAPPAYNRPGNAPYASGVSGIDRYQANQFIWYRPETARYLYEDYTPLQVGYVAGTLPGYERASALWLAGIEDQAAQAEALLRAMPAVLRHPAMPPLCGRKTPPDRNLDDEALLASGEGWCNEQARVWVRLCQVNGIPARLIHLFGQHHTVAECFVGERWVLADASHFFVVRDMAGHLLSAAACHDRGGGRRAYALAKQAALSRLAELSDVELNISEPAEAEAFRRRARAFDADALLQQETLAFGVINVPLPGDGTAQA